MKKWAPLILVLLAPVCFSQEKQKNIQYTPNIANGEKLYQTNCAMCHGSKGMSDTALGKALSKKPAAIGDPVVLNRLSPEKVFQVITQGFSDKGMPGFKHLDPKERWDMAAYVFTLNCNSQKPAPEVKPSFTWNETKAQTDSQLIDIIKKRGVPDKHIQEELAAARFIIE